MPIQQEGAPYPADLDHLDDILALGKTALPEGATNITITPATKFAESYPGGWGYVIAYHADPQPIRNPGPRQSLSFFVLARGFVGVG